MRVGQQPAVPRFRFTFFLFVKVCKVNGGLTLKILRKVLMNFRKTDREASQNPITMSTKIANIIKIARAMITNLVQYINRWFKNKFKQKPKYENLTNNLSFSSSELP